MTRLVMSARVAALALCAALLVACGNDTLDGAPEAPALLEQAATRLEQVQRFHFVLEHENGTTQLIALNVSRVEGDVEGVDKVSAMIKAMIGSVNVETAVVVIGDRGWLRNPITRQWVESDLSISQVLSPQTGVTSILRKAKDTKVVAREQVNGIDAWKVEGKLDSGDLKIFANAFPPGREIKGTAWIGVDDPLVHKIELLGQVTDGDASNTLRRMLVSKFDEPVTIEPPR